MPVVSKQFKTFNRKFTPGQEVDEAEVDNFDSWKKRGFIQSGSEASTSSTMSRPSPIGSSDTPPVSGA